MAEQDDIFAFLANPATYGGVRVERIDTHAASVFLAGERALKVKRAVKFPFLDYSTLSKRKEACDAELAVNRPFAPDIYLGVVAITHEADGTLAIGGRGEPAEWAVEMRRFDEKATLDHLADAGAIDERLADALGRAVAAGHRQMPRADAAAWIEALGRYIGQCEDAFRARPELFQSDAVQKLAASSRASLEKVTPLLQRRGADGFVRRCHGDLHLGNIVLIEGKPVLFDAIEFDPLVASGDVLYDLAFLLMDLAERALQKPANIVFNRYLDETDEDGNLDALAALPLFLSLRAAIRASVTTARLQNIPEDKRDRVVRSARAYFGFACKAIAPEQPRIVAVGGLSGTGKSVLARALAPLVGSCPGAVVLRTDVARKHLFGHAETDKLPAEAYMPEVTAKVYDLVAQKAQRATAAGHSAIVDAVFSKAHEREAIAATARASGVPFNGLFLTADLATRVARVARVGARAADASDADATIARKQEAYDLGAMDWTEVDASGTPDDTLARAKETLR
jgi:aminoglycoside phosphotransferase family enzyme/predicted kinase